MARLSRRALLGGALGGIFFGWSRALLGGVPYGQSDEPLRACTREAEAANGEISLAITHLLFAWDALSRGDLASSRLHTHQALNLLEGPGGEHYDDAYEGPQDGVGAQVHARRLLECLQQAAPGADYVLAAENVLFFLEAAIVHASGALGRLDSKATAIRELREAQGLLMAARGSREERYRPSEGGTRTILAWLEDL